MIQYRYKLSDCKANEKFSERCVERVILKKDSWVISQEKIAKFKNFQHLIIEEPFDPLIEVNNKSLEIRQNEALKKLEAEKINKEVEVTKEEVVVEEKVGNKELDAIKNMTKKELVKKIIKDKLSTLNKTNLNKLKNEELIKIIIG